MRSDDPMPAPYVAARRSAIDAILAADLAVKQLRAAGVRDDGFRAELVARCEAFATASHTTPATPIIRPVAAVQGVVVDRRSVRVLAV